MAKIPVHVTIRPDQKEWVEQNRENLSRLVREKLDEEMK